MEDTKTIVEGHTKCSDSTIVIRNYYSIYLFFANKQKIQVCYSLTAENRKREVDGLLDAMSFFQMSHGLLLTFNQYDKFMIGDKTIEVLPVSAYFKE